MQRHEVAGAVTIKRSLSIFIALVLFLISIQVAAAIDYCNYTTQYWGFDNHFNNSINGNYLSGTYYQFDSTNKIYNYSISFDEDDDALESISTSHNMTGAANRSVSIWVRFTDISTFRTYFSLGNVDTNRMRFEGLTLDSSSDAITADSWNGAVSATGGTSINAWYHILTTYNGTHMCQYVNGVKNPTSCYSANVLNTDDSTIMIGNRHGYTTQDMRGQIDEAQILNQDIGLIGAQFLYNGGAGVSYSMLNCSAPPPPPPPPPPSDMVNVTITAVNVFDDSSINSFNLTYGDGITDTYTFTHNGTIRLELNSTKIWYFVVSWYHSFLNKDAFNQPTRGENISLNTSFVGRLINSEIRFSARDNITDENISTFCVNQKPAYPPSCTTNGVASLIFKTGGSYGINATSAGYFISGTSKTVTPTNATNTTDYVTLVKHIYIYVYDPYGVPISSFTYALTGQDYEDYRTGSTSGGFVLINSAGNQTYNISINATGYAQYNNSMLKSTAASNTTYFNFTQFTTNAFDIEFLDEKTLSRVSTVTIRLDLISDTFSSNYSTSNGTIYVDALTPETYDFRYQAAGYAPRISTFVLTNNTYTQVKLYLLTTGSNITLNVVDTLNNPVENAQIHIYRYSVVSNSYILINTINTDFQGVAVTNLEKNAEFYKFYIYYNNVLKLSTSPAYITGDSIAFTINLDSPILDQYFKFGSNYTTSLVYNQDTQNFRFYYDTNGEASQGCLKLHYLTTQGETLFNSSCSASSAATILVTAANVSDRSYIARSYITVGGREYLVQTSTYQFKGIVIDSKTGLFFTFVLFFILFALATATNVSPLVISPLAFVISSALNLTNIDIGAAIGLEVLGIILAVMIGKRGD